MTTVTLEDAKEIVAAAEAKAEEIEVPMCISVADDGANLVSFHRMNGALLGSVDISQNKAYTSVSLKSTTEEVGETAQPGAALYGIGGTNGGRIVTFGGGIPLREGGDIVGAVGISGGSPDEDMAVAEAGVEAFEE
jgi:uncharacterized protein GlcG (DUF336 family)